MKMGIWISMGTQPAKGLNLVEAYSFCISSFWRIWSSGKRSLMRAISGCSFCIMYEDFVCLLIIGVINRRKMMVTRMMASPQSPHQDWNHLMAW